MKAKVRLSYTVELVVEGKDMEAISDWMAETTPNEAYNLVGGIYESFDDKVLNVVDDNVKADYIIRED